ncbi:MAG: hypothetical protein NVV62_13340 [Terricaulis sp.]|nr:hypothetical protein [Terricaulis sp.]
MSALRLAFALGEGGVAPSPALSVQRWIGGASGEAERPLLVCDLSADASTGIAASNDLWTWFGVQILPGDLAAPPEAQGLLINVMTIGEAQDEEFNDWYNTEHMPRLMALEGVLAARRFRVIDGAPRYAALYHLSHRDICQGPRWVAAATTPWTKRMQRYRTGNKRMTFTRAP